jgi:hypothetical protein
MGGEKLYSNLINLVTAKIRALILMKHPNHPDKIAIALLFILFSVSMCNMVKAQPGSVSAHIVSFIDNTSLSVRDVHTDCKGDIVYVGGTGSSAFSISPNTISTSYNGGNSDVFIVKIDSTGLPVWSTLLGGNLYDRAYAIEIDSAGFIYVAGRAGTGLSTTTCALQTNFAGDNNANSAYGIQDGFIAKITPDGSTVVWCTYIGCDGRGFVRDIDLDSQGNIWAGISNASPNFPHITSNAVQPTATATMNPALIKLSSNGETLLYGTFLSDGVATSAGPTTVRVDKNDNVYFLSHASANTIPVTQGVFQPGPAGNIDFVLSKFDSGGNLLFCTFLGGPGEEEVETHSLEIDTAGNPVVAAYTFGSGYPIVGNVVQTSFGGARDGVITKIAADGSAILASTYLGGTQVDELQGIGIDANNNIYVTGRTSSANFPVTTNTAYQSSPGGAFDGHISVLSPDLTTVLYATFVGGIGNEDLRTCHVDEYGKIHSGGNTASANFPILNAFNASLTGTLTGTAIVFRPDSLFHPSNVCSVSNSFTDPCLNTGSTNLNTNAKSFSLYPNPTSNVLTIDFGFNQNKNVRFKIYNLIGVLIQEVEAQQTTQINIADLPAGLYFVHSSDFLPHSHMFFKQ